MSDHFAPPNLPQQLDALPLEMSDLEENHFIEQLAAALQENKVVQEWTIYFV
jgi:hypothetical protein